MTTIASTDNSTSPLQLPDGPTLLFGIFSDDEPHLEHIFSVQTSPNETISQLRLKIWNENRIECSHIDARDLVLCVPTKPVSTDNEELFKTQLNQLQNGKAFVQKLNPSFTVANSRLSQPVEGQLHLFIMIPSSKPLFTIQITSSYHLTEQPKLKSTVTDFKPEEAALWRLLVNVVLLAPEKSSTSADRPDNTPFKLELYKFYYDPKAERYPEMLTCSLTGVTLSYKAIVAAHLWPHSKGMSWEWFGFDNIDDPRNGLLLYKPIEEEYDRHNICFYQDRAGKLRCRVLCEALRTKTFQDSFAKHKVGRTTGIEAKEVQRAAPILAAAGYTTFADLEKPEVYLRCTSMTPGPFKRVLNFHAIRAYIMAKERGDAALQNFIIEDFYSDENYYGARNVIEAWRMHVDQSLHGPASSGTITSDTDL